MFSIFQKDQYKKSIGFEDVKTAVRLPTEYLLINTMNVGEQDIRIKNTIDISEEETIINKILSIYSEPDKPIIIYGKNSMDNNTIKKYDQLVHLGLKDVYIYYGGLFEWLLLNEIYGDEEFPLNKHGCVDLLKYRPLPLFNKNML